MSRPWGVDGGEAGAIGETWMLPQGDESRSERLLDKCTVRMRAGDVLRMLTPGGGGYGPLPEPTANQGAAHGNGVTDDEPASGTSQGRRASLGES